MNAIILKRILLIVIAGLLFACVAGQVVLVRVLQQNIVATDHAKVDADISNGDIQQLKRLQEQLGGLQDVVARTKDIVATSANYKYQDQVITDINHLAAATGVTVTGYAFPNISGTTTGSTSTVSSGTTATPQVVVPGAKLLTITITMKSPMPYDNYLKFLRSLELNLTRLQVTGIDLSPDLNNSAQITNPAIGIQIYVKS